MPEYFVRRYTELVKEKPGTDIIDTQLAYSIRFYCMGSVGMTQEWVLNDNIPAGTGFTPCCFFPQSVFSSAAGDSH